jgi:hypothetical protein
VIQQLPPNAADETLSRSVLPRASERGLLWIYLETLDRVSHRGGEDRVVVED